MLGYLKVITELNQVQYAHKSNMLPVTKHSGLVFNIGGLYFQMY
jgi:hypothetical protein